MVNKITDFGYNFQIKTIVCLMRDVKFIEQIHDILDEKHFDNEAIKWIIKNCREYYDEYKTNITLDVFKIKSNEVKNEILKTTVVDTLREVYKHLEATDLEFVQDKALDFFKNQALKNAILNSVDILEQKGDFDQIKILIDDAMKAGTERNLGHDYLEDFEVRYSEMARETIPTNWDVINELMQGGLGKGELGVVVAPAGIGKSWVLATIGADAIKNGYSVVHYTLELNEAYVGLRYDSIFSGIANQNLKYHKDDIEKEIEKLKGNLTIKYFPTKTASVHTIQAHLQKMKTLGHEVDLVIMDYADIMKDTSNAREVRHQLGNIYEDLRGTAGEIEVPIWTASQANRSALDEDNIEAQHIAESYQKVMTADFVMSLSRKVEDKIGNTGRFHVMKNRFGPDGITYPASVNTNNGKIEIYESSSVDGKTQSSKMKNKDEFYRKLLANKYDELSDD